MNQLQEIAIEEALEDAWCREAKGEFDSIEEFFEAAKDKAEAIYERLRERQGEDAAADRGDYDRKETA